MKKDIILNEVSFKDYLFKNKISKKILYLSGIVLLLEFSIFKYIYPYASYIHGDSFSYLNAAQENLSINTYLIGYSKFLRLFSVFTKSDLALTSFQFLLIETGALSLLFTLFYFYDIRGGIKNILLFIVLINPLFIHLANLVSSDCIFVAISLYWMTVLLWLVHRPNIILVVIQSILLLLLFTIRYNALIYPFITILTFIICRLPLKVKIIGTAIGFIACIIFVLFTSYEYKKLTGYHQYSPFSGWQIANNAMYAYRYVDKAKRRQLPLKFQQLDSLVTAYFDTTRDAKRYPFETIMASTYYMWSPGLPLYKYRDSLFKKDTTATELKKWASMGPFYKSYGIELIKKYPVQYIKYFIWPNFNKYFAPPVEFLQDYNSGKPKVSVQAMKWFNYKSQTVKTRLKTEKTIILNYMPIFSGITNVGYIALLVCFSLLRGWNLNRHISKSIFLSFIIWLFNATFTIIASSAALRFQAFPIFLTCIFSFVLLDWILRYIKTTTSLENQKQSNQNMSLSETTPVLISP